MTPARYPIWRPANTHAIVTIGDEKAPGCMTAVATIASPTNTIAGRRIKVLNRRLKTAPIRNAISVSISVDPTWSRICSLLSRFGIANVLTTA
jgi:hypothetical protein